MISTWKKMDNTAPTYLNVSPPKNKRGTKISKKNTKAVVA
jgi:hypothetical protein